MTTRPEKKPISKVRSIKGKFAPDVVTQAELIEASELQATVWLAEKNAREVVQAIAVRIAHGATVEDGDLMFDAELQMARRKKRKEGSG